MRDRASDDSERLADVSRWYDRNYHDLAGDRPRHHRLTAEYFLPHVLPRAVDRYLDVACGTGELLAAARGRARFRAGVDLSAKAIEIARASGAADELHVAPAESLPFDNDAFDIVSCMGAIEHFVSPIHALAEMRRVAASHAAFFFLVPNREYLAWRLSHRSGTSQQAAEETTRRLTEWRELFARSGFRTASVRADRRPCKMWWIREARGPRRFLKATSAAALWVLPMTFQYQFLFELYSGDVGGA